MERIAGDSLAALWSSMMAAENEYITSKLRASMDQLRCLPSPGGCCSLGKRGLMDWVSWAGNSMNTLAIEGPFDTEDELNAAMIGNYLFDSRVLEKARFYERAFPRVLCGHSPVFTHGDF
jgi:hypothetical protein